MHATFNFTWEVKSDKLNTMYSTHDTKAWSTKSDRLEVTSKDRIDCCRAMTKYERLNDEPNRVAEGNETLSLHAPCIPSTSSRTFTPLCIVYCATTRAIRFDD